MVELDVKVDGFLSHVADAKSYDVVVLGKGRVVLVLSSLGAGVLVDCFLVDDVEVEF